MNTPSKTRQRLAKLSFAPAAKGNIELIADNLIPTQAKEHGTHVKKGSVDIKKRILGSSPSEKILHGGVILRKKDSLPLGYFLLSDTFGPDGPGGYLEDFMMVPGHQGKGHGKMAVLLMKYVATSLRLKSLSCTVDSDRHDTMRFYTGKIGMKKHQAPLLDISDDRMTAGFIPSPNKAGKEVRIVEADDLNDISCPDLKSTLDKCVNHPHNFAAISRPRGKKGPVAVTFANVSTSTFQNCDGVNILETTCSDNRPVPTDTILAHLAALRNEARQRQVDHHVKVKLDSKVSLRRIFKKMSEKCVSHMTEADTHEIRFDVSPKDIPGDIDDIPNDIQDQLDQAFSIS